MRTIHKTVRLVLPAGETSVSAKVLENVKPYKLKEVRAYSGPSSSTIAGFPVADYAHEIRVKKNGITVAELTGEPLAYRKAYLKGIPFSGELTVELSAPTRDQDIETYVALVIEE